MNLKTAHISRILVAFAIAIGALVAARAGSGTNSTTDYLFHFSNKIEKEKPDTTRYPIKDRYGDPYSNPNKNSFDLSDTAFIKRKIEYDPKTKQYYVVEKIGDKYYRTPTSFSMEEFLRLQGREDEENYFRKRAALLGNMNRRLFKPKFRINEALFNRIIGAGPDGKVNIDIRPTGSVDLIAGYNGQKIMNPTLPERARKNGGLDFNMNSQLNVDAKIGDKIKLPINYNTLANFGFENQLKLDYRGQEDDIVKQFTAGNTSFQTKSTLIPGVQSLFGLKTQLQFGKAFFTLVLANQQSQRQSLGLQGGSSTQNFTVKADEYDENRHFLFAQYFRNNFNKAMKNLPIVNSPIQIMKVEVWVTNRNGTTTDTRDVIAFMDLGETQPYRPALGGGGTMPYNNANGLYGMLMSNPNVRNSSLAFSTLTAAPFNLLPVQDFERTFARKLNPSEYYFNQRIGFLSLNQPLQPDEVLGVAIQYTYNGKPYQIGEFSQDVPPDSTGTSQKVLFLKMLKATSQRTNLPIWDLMMKNVYSVGYGQLERQDFTLDVNYEEPSLGVKRYFPLDSVLPQYKGQPLISLMNLDRLNDRLDPQPDGKFDYIDSFTVVSQQSRIIFPVLEPFGHDLDYVFPNQQMRDKFLYYPLYDTIKAIAQTFTNLNKFKMVGKSKSSGGSMGGYGGMGGMAGGGFGNNGMPGGSGGFGNNTGSGEYQLGYNIPRGSVRVSANGQMLIENVDYEINYDLGTLRVTNAAVLSSGIPVNIQYESNQAFGFQQRSFMGMRFDYLANKKLTLGATIQRLSERPFFTKQSYGDDPIRNTIFGVDADYKSDWPRLTKWLDKLPFYSTKTMSSISAYAEAAYLKPGHPPQIDGLKDDNKTRDKGGQVYIDDFEGTRSNIDLRFPLISWALASVPQGNNNASGTAPLFPESALNNDSSSGFNRAKIAWYNIEPVLQEKGNPNNPLKSNLAELSKPETRQVYQKEIFPRRGTQFGEGLLTTFDIAFYPKDKGPYNFEFRNTRTNANGKLLNPQQAWGGLMRSIDQTDFETANIEFIEFWMQDPFIKNTANPLGGQLYFNLGNVSEDILKDGKRMYENGLPTPPNFSAPVDKNTVWGQVPSNPMQVTNAFSTNPDDRQYQDVGFDGLRDDDERTKFSPYLNKLATNFGLNSQAYIKAQADPSNDNFVPYRDPSFDQGTPAGILNRYKSINNPSGNSPIATGNTEFINAYTQYPDGEDLNRDNTMNEVEEYFQYRVDIRPGMTPANTQYITDMRTVSANLADGTTRSETWYLFRIPVHDYQQKVGNIPDFKSIRFMRMFMTGFQDSIVLRFGKLELVRNQWRKFKNKIDSTGQFVSLPAPDPVSLNTLAVNIEENDQRQPIPYRIPPGIERQQLLSNNNVPIQMNEQALSVQICGLPIGESRGVFKTMSLNMVQYKRLSMFIHAEAAQGTLLSDGDLYGVARLGNDLSGNYYEVKVPLKITPPGTTDSTKIWPLENNLDFSLQDLVELKKRRDRQGIPASTYYKEVLPNGRTLALIGNPSLGEVKGILLAVENQKVEMACTEVWFNELRLNDLNEQGGWAAIGRVDLKLADLGTLTVSGTAKSFGFGAIEQRLMERSRENIYTFDATTSIEAGKLLPKKLGIQIPVYAAISKTISDPQYNPYKLDVKQKDVLKEAPAGKRDSIKNESQDVTTIKTLNFTNVKKVKTDGKKPKVWSVSNFDFNYSYIETTTHNPLIEEDELRRTRGSVGYNYAPTVKPFTPFKKLIKSKSPWFSLIKDFNINYLPSQIAFKADLFRQFGSTRPRNVDGGPYKIPQSFSKFFTFDRYYILQWNLTQSISIDYMAINNARVDEPFGPIDTKEKKDSIRKNLLKGGRNTQFNQDLTVRYNVPTRKIPLLDWTTLSASYNTKYNWLAASLLARELGNTLSNTQTRTLNGELNFENLYNKWRFLRAVNSSQSGNNNRQNKQDPNNNIPGSKDSGKSSKKKNEKGGNLSGGDKKGNDNQLNPGGVLLPGQQQMDTSKKALGKNGKVKKAKEKKVKIPKDPNYLPQVGVVPKAFFRLLTSLKRVGIQVSEDFGTTLPGYMDSTKLLGYNPRSSEPGFGFIFGYQPDTNWINRFGNKGLLSRDSLVSDMIRQRYNQRINITAQISPFRDFNIDVNLDKTFDKQYSELYKDTTGHSGLTRLSPYALGSFSVSYIAFQTLFRKFNPEEVSTTFKEFENNRLVLSQRLKTINPYAAGNGTGADGYVQGYGRYAQDVVIPAFIAAYTKKDPASIQLAKNNNPNIRSNPFSGIMPKPNWTLNYSGLSRIPGLDKIFTNFTLRHGYHSTFSMNSFNTALLFADRFHVGYPEFRDTLTGNYIPYFLVPNITIQEAFDPLIAVDMTFTNQLNTRFEFKKSRTLSLSLIDYQLAENHSTEVTFGFDWRRKGVPLIKKLPFVKGKLDNDVTFRIDYSMRDDATANSKLDQRTSYGTAGQKVTRIAPSIDYIVNNKVSIKLYYERNKSVPKISNSFPVTNTRAGVQVRISLSQ
ncbi:MAG: cell surface protein SprA [Bacteroidetes bacterium]|nr:cell surface protein SprA [Bacteroidota bacterium]